MSYDIDDKLERLRLDSEVSDLERKNAENKAVIRELKRRYGRDWKSFLRISDSESLRQLAEGGKRADITAGSFNRRRDF